MSEEIKPQDETTESAEPKEMTEAELENASGGIIAVLVGSNVKPLRDETVVQKVADPTYKY